MLAINIEERNTVVIMRVLRDLNALVLQGDDSAINSADAVYVHGIVE
ncbi:hypothetical protein GCM10022414_17440 [Zhongshania borealis]|uniref:Uncharacterized protein n=1 Tax=Zhongshania borealis TaxID=889488 RepID=A0ABP7WQC7_9GAMM